MPMHPEWPKAGQSLAGNLSKSIRAIHYHDSANIRRQSEVLLSVHLMGEREDNQIEDITEKIYVYGSECCS